MLFHLLAPLSDQFGPLNLFRYITFRSGGAVVTALVISFVMGPRVIAWLKSKQAEGQPIRLDGPESHLIRKKGTPTMGGFLDRKSTRLNSSHQIISYAVFCLKK